MGRLAPSLRCFAFAALLAACGPSPPPEPAPGCNPLGEGDCLTPFPSLFFTREVGGQPGRKQVDLRPEVMPKQAMGIGPIRPDRLNLRDGFSASTPFIVHFERGVDPAQLPPFDDPGRSLDPASPVQIFEVTTGERIPLFAELDANVFEGDRQALIIRPLQPLGRLGAEQRHRFVVALVNLRDRQGELLTTPGFRALRDRAPLNQALAPLEGSYEVLFDYLAARGVPRASLSLAWEVPIDGGQSPLPSLIGRALADTGQLGWTIDSVVEDPDDALRLREVNGTFEAPSFLETPDATSRLASLTDPVGRLRAPFTVTIPRCAESATAPLPIMMFGHGIFGAARGEMAGGNAKKQAERVCAIQVGTDWRGLSSDDLAVVIGVVLSDLNNFEITTDQLVQGHVNFQVLTRLFKTRMKDDPAFAVAGKPVTDGARVYYWGASNGGIQGATFLALSEDVSRAALNVPGADWNLMMFRSANFTGLLPILAGVLPDPLDQQLWVAMTQTLWDTTDPAAYAHLILGPPNRPSGKAVLLQEAIGDTQVPNLATRFLARAIGLSGINLQEPVFGVENTAGPLPSAYTQWNVASTPRPPTTNQPSPVKNGAHDAIRNREELIEQNVRFLRPDGQVENTCTGPCTF